MKNRKLWFVFGIPALLLGVCVAHYAIAILAGDTCMRSTLFSGNQAFSLCAKTKYSDVHSTGMLKSTLSPHGYDCKEADADYEDARHQLVRGRAVSCDKDVFIHPFWARRYYIAVRFSNRGKFDGIYADAWFESTFDHLL